MERPITTVDQDLTYRHFSPDDAKELKKLVRMVNTAVDRAEAYNKAARVYYGDEITALESGDNIPVDSTQSCFFAADALTEVGLFEAYVDAADMLMSRQDIRISGLDERKQLVEESHPSLYSNNFFGLSALDILRPRKAEKIVEETPIELFGLMIRSVDLPDNMEQMQEGIHAFLAVVLLPTQELREIVKKGQFPHPAGETLIDMSILYQKLLREMRNSLFDPDSEHFYAAVDVYSDILENGTRLQQNLFSLHVLGNNNQGSKRGAYSITKKLLADGKEPAFYNDVLSRIEGSFTSHRGEDIYEPLGLEIQPDAEVNTDALAALHKKKKYFLEQMKDQSGEISLDDGMYGDVFLLGPKIEYVKNGDKTKVILCTSIDNPSDELVYVDFFLPSDGFDWNILRDPDEVPELFNVIVGAADSAIDRAMPKEKSVAERPPIVLPPERVIGGKRNNEKRKNGGGAAEMTGALPVSLELFAEVLETADLDVRGVIEKYREGRAHFQRLRNKSNGNEDHFLLSVNGIRVEFVLNQETGQLKVVDRVR